MEAWRGGEITNHTTKENDKVLAISPEEAFRKLGVSRALGYKLIKDGSIPAIRLGERRLVVPVAALEKLLEF